MLTLVEKVFRLHNIRLFGALSTGDLQALAEIAEVVEYVPGDRIITEGEVGDCLYVLLRGEVAVVREQEGRKVELARLSVGNVFGEMAILTEETRSANVDAVTDCECLSIEREPFRSLVEERPQIAFGIFEALSARIREADRRMAELRPK